MKRAFKAMALATVLVVSIAVIAVAINWTALVAVGFGIRHEQKKKRDEKIAALPELKRRIAESAQAPWRTYTNPHFEYDIDYPGDWVVWEGKFDEASRLQVVQISPSGRLREMTPLFVNIQRVSAAAGLEGVLVEQRKYLKPSSEADFPFPGGSAKEMRLGSGERVVYFLSPSGEPSLFAVHFASDPDLEDAGAEAVYQRLAGSFRLRPRP